MPGPDLQATADRAGRAHRWCTHIRSGEPPSQDVRVHFETDIPALIREIEWLRKQLVARGT
jgi:hypothetical protein